MKKLAIFALTFLSTIAFASVTQSACQQKGDKYIFAGGECIQYAVFKGEVENAINIVVHGTWKEGTNTLGRYAPFAETLTMNTDITTIAVALPGYSDSSTNNLKSLSHGGPSVYTKEYINFMAALINGLKNKFNATSVNYMGHSAGASLGANTLSQYPDIVSSMTLAGGRYDLNKFSANEQKGLISIGNHLNAIGETQILLVYGTEDKISEPSVTTSFYEKAKKQGLDVKLVEVKGAAHLDLDMTDPCVEAFTEMVAE